MTTVLDSAQVELPPAAMVIGDELVAESSGGVYEHVYPGSGSPHPPVPMAGAREVDAAVQAARAALPVWRSMTADRRRDVLLRLADLLAEHSESLTRISIQDNGMPISITRWAVFTAVDLFRYNAGWVDKIGGDVVPVWPNPAFDYTCDEPYGVVGVIVPWNGPMFAIGMVLAPALAAGNCVVLKPSELAPFAALRFGALCQEAGLPPGVVNVLPGGAEGGSALVSHPGVDKIHFTGSVPTAANILATAAPTVKPVALELGGKSASIVFADADLESASVQAAMNSIILASGQGCLNGTRLLVQDEIYDEFLARVVAVAEQTRIGDPYDEETVMGPVISEAACSRIQGVVERAVSGGMGSLLTGGERLGGELAAGYYLAPTVFGDVDNASELAQEEIFGPVLAAMRFRDEADAVALANDTRYGLAGYVFTNDLKRAHRVARDLDAGFVAVNQFDGLPSGAPFGGNKSSGFGRLGGRAGLNEFLRPKNVYVSLVDGAAPAGS